MSLRFYTAYDLELIKSGSRTGQSLVEVLIGVVVGTIMVLGAITIISPTLQGQHDAARTQAAAAAGRALLDNIRTWGQSDWHNIGNLSTSSVNYFLNSGTSPFAAATGTEGLLPEAPLGGLVGYWKLDESEGGALDYSGSEYAGLVNGGPVASSSCAAGGCLSFNGSSDFLDMGTSTTDTIESAGTISAWVYRKGVTGGILSRSTGTGWNDERLVIFFRSDTSQWGWSFANGATYQAPQWASSTFPDNQWVHLALTWNGSTATTYMNGKIFDNRSQTVSPEVTGVKMRVGWTEGLAGQFFDGLLDEIRIYNRALSESEIQTIFQAEKYTRYFNISEVGRDGSGNIVDGGGTNDPSTRKVAVVYGWPGGPTSTISAYLTRFRNRTTWQTDWSGGSGQDGPATTTSSRFATSTAITVTSSTGSISIDL